MRSFKENGESGRDEIVEVTRRLRFNSLFTIVTIEFIMNTK
jgi:hypothetical protein